MTSTCSDLNMLLEMIQEDGESQTSLDLNSENNEAMNSCDTLTNQEEIESNKSALEKCPSETSTQPEHKIACDSNDDTTSTHKRTKTLTDVDFLHIENSLFPSQTSPKERFENNLSLQEYFEGSNDCPLEGKSIISVGVKDNLHNFKKTSSDMFRNKIPSNNVISGAKLSQNVICDSFLGIRVKNPLLSMEALKEMMNGRELISLSTVGLEAKIERFTGDWVIAGVIVSKSESKISQKGSSYCIWQLSDLKDCEKMISLFLFGSAYTQLWKTIVGSVVGILNPQVMKGSDQKGNYRSILTLSVMNHEKVLLIGSSKDLGWCKSRTNTGANCRQFVNLNVCDVCVYHIQKEYRKTSSSRAAIQSSFSNKMLSSFPFRKGAARNTSTLRSYKQQPFSEGTNKKFSSGKATDDTLLSRLLKSSPAASRQLTCSNKTPSIQPSTSKPLLSAREILRENISELSSSKNSPSCLSKKASRAQAVALSTVMKKGPFEKLDLNMKRNKEKSVSKQYQERILKRLQQNEFPQLEDKSDESAETGEIDLGTVNFDVHKSPEILPTSVKVDSSLFSQMMNKKSVHSNLISMKENERLDEYYDVLEKKEKMENKLASIKEITVGAVVCMQCKYKATSAAPRCLEGRHMLRNIKSIKRFFECSNCKRRVSCLGRMPSLPCSGCNEKNFRRVGMAKDKSGPKLESEILSLRGDELRYFSSCSSDVFLHL